MRKTLELAVLAAVAALVLGFGVAGAHNRDGPMTVRSSLAPLSHSSVVVADLSATNLNNVLVSPTTHWLVSQSQELEGNLRTGNVVAATPVLLFYIAIFALALIIGGHLRQRVSRTGTTRTPKGLYERIGGATASSLRPVFGVFALALGLIVVVATAFFATSSSVAYAGNGEWLGQDGSAGVPVWTLVALALGSVALVVGGMITRRAGK